MPLPRKAVSSVACLKPPSARGLGKRVLERGSDRRKDVSGEPSLFHGAGRCDESCRCGQLHEPSVRPILGLAYSHYKVKTISFVWEGRSVRSSSFEALVS